MGKVEAYDSSLAMAQASTPSPDSSTKLPSIRIAALDGYRGFVMFLMMGEVLRFCDVAKALPESSFWALLCKHQSHVSWVGCVLHDMIQPSFSFLVGAALPFSIANRLARGQSQGSLTRHALWRALALTLLGVFLRSTHSVQTRWTFEDTLSQIGMGYLFLFILGFQSIRAQWIALTTVLVGYWAAFAWYPLPPPDFDYATVGVTSDWLKENGLTGFARHWQKNSNLAWAVDTWWMNLFPRAKPFIANDGGYSTLSFIPTLGTMILGLLAGGVLKSERSAGAKIRWFLVAGAIALAMGWGLGEAGICPVVKRIWTPSWVLFSGGWCFIFLAAFYALMDLAEVIGVSLVLKVVGMNSIAAYLIAHLWDDFIAKNLVIHLGQNFFNFFGTAYQPFFHGAAILLVYWLILYWMYRRKIFLRL
jgi:predicted acyltransferase